LSAEKQPLPYSKIFFTWLPLAASWLLMATELPMLSAVIARLENPEVSLAAYGGIIFPLSLLIEAPIIMLLAASTALSKDRASYELIRRFMLIAAGVLTASHILIAFTPLYYFIVRGIMGAPEAIVEPARIGLMIMTPWTASIAYRRFNQGVLIRYGHPHAITIGTVIRLLADALVLAIGYFVGTIPGIIVATSAVATGVISEAVYTGFIVQPVIKNRLNRIPPIKPPLTWKAFFAFYIPLAMTSLILLIGSPISSAAMSRMPLSIASLAAWTVVSGFLFMLRSAGMAYNEVVVALLDKPRAFYQLRRFTFILAGIMSGILLLLTATPLSTFWFTVVSNLSPELTTLAKNALWFVLLVPALNVIQSWYQGSIVHGRKTRGITEAVLIYIFTNAIILSIGIVVGKATGLYVAVTALTIGMITQTAWLWFRSRPVRKELEQNETI